MSHTGTHNAALNTKKQALELPAGYDVFKTPSDQMRRVFVKPEVAKRAKQTTGSRLIAGHVHVPFKDVETGNTYFQDSHDLVPEKARGRSRAKKAAPVQYRHGEHIGKPRSRRRR